MKLYQLDLLMISQGVKNTRFDNGRKGTISWGKDGDPISRVIELGE
jgi:hypothetical protein